MVKKKRITKFEQRLLLDLYNNKLLVLALFFLSLFFFGEVIIRSYNWYYIYPWVDLPSHFLAGVTLCIFGYYILAKKLKKEIREHLTLAYTLGFTFACSILWECLETLEDWFVYNPTYLQDFFFYDGLTDILAAVVGCFVAWIIISLYNVWLRKKFSKIYNLEWYDKEV